MKKYTLIFLFFFFSYAIFAQKTYTLTDSDTFQVARGFTILADKNYTFEQVLTDSSLPFGTNDTLNIKQNAAYWYKAVIKNPSVYDEKYNVECFPWVDFTVYYFDYQQNKWLNQRTGYAVADGKRMSAYNVVTLRGQQETVLYFKANVAPLKHLKTSFFANVALRKAGVAEKKNQFIDTSTLLTLLIVGLFFLFNAYIYYIFRDKTYFYYLIVQLAGMGYILTTHFYLNVLLPFKITRFDSDSSYYFKFWNLNQLGNQLSMVVLFAGFIQLTRAYLNTATLLPKQDKLLKYCLITYTILGVVLPMVTATGLAFIDHEVVFVLNTLTVVIMGAIFYTTFLSYRQGYKPARYFLFSNFIPLFVILILALYYLFFWGNARADAAILANIAIIAQAFCLAVALVERFLLIKDELKQRELEAQELKAQNERIASENQFHKNELDNYTQLLREKTEAFDKLKTDLDTFNMSSEHKNWHSQLTQASILTEEHWRDFKYKFENVHADFFNRLQYHIPTVTEAEKRFMALTKLEMSNNEIASMLGISPESVTKTRYRLRKKVGEEDLEMLMDRL